MMSVPNCLPEPQKLCGNFISSNQCILHQVSLNAKMQTWKREPENTGEIQEEGAFEWVLYSWFFFVRRCLAQILRQNIHCSLSKGFIFVGPYLAATLRQNVNLCKWPPNKESSVFFFIDKDNYMGPWPLEPFAEVLEIGTTSTWSHDSTSNTFKRGVWHMGVSSTSASQLCQVWSKRRIGLNAQEVKHGQHRQCLLYVELYFGLHGEPQTTSMLLKQYWRIVNKRSDSTLCQNVAMPNVVCRGRCM